MPTLSLLEVFKKLLRESGESSALLATAVHYKAKLWTQDDDFEDIPGVRHFPERRSAH